MPSAGRTVGAAAVAIAMAVAGWKLHQDPGRGREWSFTLLAGAAAGFIFQRSRFCFASTFREFFLRRDRRGLLGLIAALAVGGAGYMVVFGAWVTDPSRHLPTTAHVAPLGWHLVLGGAVFGFGMALGRGCVSGHLFRLGEGSAVALVGLAGVFAGAVVGLAVWNPVFLHLVTGPEVWLPQRFGYAIAFALQTGALAAGAIFLLRRAPAPATATSELVTDRTVLRRVFCDPWPAAAGGLALGILASAAYLRVTPLSVTGELSRQARRVGVVPDQLLGLDAIRGCATISDTGAISSNGIFVIAFVAGSLLAALVAGEFRPRLGSASGHLRAAAGGVLVGFGAMIALGCTVGTLMSGIMAFSLSGWVFLAALAAGAWAGARLLERRTP